MTDLTKRLENEPLLSPDLSPNINSVNDGYQSTLTSNNNRDAYDIQDSYDSFPSMEPNGSVNSEKIEEVYRTYWSRWYILILFSLVAFTQSGTWNTWGPIADTTKAVLGWTDADIALLTNWGPITYVISAPFFSWVMDVKGLKMSMLMASTLEMIGVAIRCIPVPLKYLKWVMNAGHVFIGLAGPVLMACPPLVSATWFPPHQRTTSTAYLTAMAYMGVACSFLIGPLIVSNVHILNSTAIVPIVNESIYDLYEGSQPNTTIIPSVKHNHLQEINLLMYIEAGFMAILFIMTWVYFPAKPPTPPSASAETKREDFLEGAKILFTSTQFWLPALCYSISSGVYNVWGTQLDTIFYNTVGVGQGIAGWIGFYSNIAGVVGSLVLARFVDLLGGKMKLVLLLLTSCGIGCVVWIILICEEVIVFNLPSLYVSIISLAVIVNSTIPLYFEITVEGTYPVAEGITAMIMTWLNNLYGLIFLLIMLSPSIGVLWTNYAVLGAVAICIPMLLVYKERYNRLSQDTAAEEKYK
ncbi:solute carrier family 49 member 4-like [Amphiura filiformis]|uniref:solute carrier family 49 member 4-like n=1 Tax=Amphiura filiformis TaxID=82378 RepID=UPI003B21698C